MPKCYAGHIGSTVLYFFSREFLALCNSCCFASKVLCVVMYQRLVCRLHNGNEASRSRYLSCSHRLMLLRLSSFTSVSYTGLSSCDKLFLRRCTLANSGCSCHSYNNKLNFSSYPFTSYTVDFS